MGLASHSTPGEKYRRSRNRGKACWFMLFGIDVLGGFWRGEWDNVEM